jgi:hypothetical protein
MSVIKSQFHNPAFQEAFKKFKDQIWNGEIPEEKLKECRNESNRPVKTLLTNIRYKE